MSLGDTGQDASEFLKMALLSEEIGKIGRDGIDHCHQFIRSFVGYNELVIICKRFKITLPQAFSQSGLNQLLLPVMEVDPAVFINEPADSLKIKRPQFIIWHGSHTSHSIDHSSVFGIMPENVINIFSLPFARIHGEC